MKDLDFDELDRAVNSLIAKNPASPTPDDVSTMPAPAQSVQNDDMPAVTPIAVPTVERPSTGRFMDVVHPSSDMRMSLVAPERSSAFVAEPVNQPVQVPQPVMSVQNDPPTAGADNKDEDSDIDQISNDIAKTLGQTSSEPLNSPFLSNPKVEKRPLNSLSDQFVTQSTETSKPDATGNRGPDSLITPLPAELQNDLLAIESDTTIQPDVPQLFVKDAPVVEPIVTSESKTEPNATPQEATGSAVSGLVKPIVAPVQTAMQGSIPPQYQEQPSSSKQDSGPIYDTNSYHKAIVSPVKKKSGLTTIVWIVLLLLLGAGAGAAFYYFVLPLI